MIQVIVFSKNRPLQLHGYLASLFAQWRGDFRVDVLTRADEPYTEAYREVMREFCDRVAFFAECEFPVDLQDTLQFADADFVCFGCDDAVFVAPVETAALERAFTNPDLLGVSFRLGRSITRGMFGARMAQPAFLPAVAVNTFDDVPENGPSLVWDVRAAASDTDWAYPWEVTGTVYDGEYTRRMVADLVAKGLCNTPNQLEHNGAQRWHEHTSRYLMRAWLSSRLVLTAVNVVQNDFPNGIVGEAPLTPEYLLDLWQKGVRLDTERFAELRHTWDTWRIGQLQLRRPTK